MEYSLRSFVCVILCRNCRWTITSRARESLRCRTRYQRLYGDIGYGRWGQVRFSLARLFFHFSFRFSFFFFSLFETTNYGISVQRKRNFLNLMLVIPCLFRCLSPDCMSISVIQSPETARDIFPCVSFILSHFIFSLFLYSSKEIRAHPDIPSLVCSSPFMDQDIVIGLSFEGVHWWFRPLYRWENDRGFKKVAIAGIFNGN